MGASQSALSIQNPSQTGPRTQGDGHFRTHGAAVAISTTAAGEESSAIRAIAECAVGGALSLILSGNPLFLEFHVNPAAGESDVNASTGGGQKDLHTILICHRHCIPSPDHRHTCAARVVVTLEILQSL
jgi:hypothetical protein